VIEDPEFKENLIKSFRDNWIVPEIVRRGADPDTFQFHRCLIRLPQEHPPIVEFDEEVELVSSYEAAPGQIFSPGELVGLHQIKRFTKVQRPEFENVPVAFALVVQIGTTRATFFEFTPNNSELDIDIEFRFGEAIASFFNRQISSSTMKLASQVNPQLTGLGLWAAPALIPYPLGLISKLLEEGKVSEARATFCSHCSSAFLGSLVDRWFRTPVFRHRERLLRDAMSAHKQGQFGLSIYALTPQVEGIISDWLWQNHPGRDIPWRSEPKTRKLQEILLEISGSTEETHHKILASTFEFVTTVVMEQFRWAASDSSVNLAFPGRNAVSHGRYVEELYSEENSIKLFLLLDTIEQLLGPQLDVD
jgi:hypothetical protein